jgi:N-dimethylarginine dimethylaminohydrolase
VNEYGCLRRAVLRPALTAFISPERIEREWRGLNFTAPPDLALACEQYHAFRDTMAAAGVHVDEVLADDHLTLDAIYLRDAVVLTPRGTVACRMGKPARRDEPAALARHLAALGVPLLGAIEAPGVLEGGDVLWFDERTVAVGRGYRTNDEGIAQLRTLLGPDVEAVVVPLPHYRGPSDVFHLMSILSPLDRDLAVAYSPLMPVPFREWLCTRGVTLVEVPDEEFDSMGANVLALAPRLALMLAGNPVTRARLERAGVRVLTYEGSEISVKGGGGPTCLTRALVRDVAASAAASGPAPI